MLTDKSIKVKTSSTLEQRIEQIFALLWLVVGAVVMIQSRDLEYKAEYGPGAGFLPFWMGVGFIFLGLFLLAKLTFKRKEKDEFSLPSKQAAWQMFLIMVIFFGFVFLADRLGFLFSIGLLFLFLLGFVERQGWKFSLTVSIISVFIFWLIFELGLGMKLPLGIFDSLL